MENTSSGTLNNYHKQDNPKRLISGFMFLHQKAFALCYRSLYSVLSWNTKMRILRNLPEHATGIFQKLMNFRREKLKQDPYTKQRSTTPEMMEIDQFSDIFSPFNFFFNLPLILSVIIQWYPSVTSWSFLKICLNLYLSLYFWILYGVLLLSKKRQDSYALFHNHSYYSEIK